jgi:hypothetical protein
MENVIFISRARDDVVELNNETNKPQDKTASRQSLCVACG